MFTETGGRRETETYRRTWRETVDEERKENNKSTLNPAAGLYPSHCLHCIAAFLLSVLPPLNKRRKMKNDLADQGRCDEWLWKILPF